MEAQVPTSTRDLTQALYVAAVALGRTRDAEEVVRVAITETQRASGVEAVSLYLLDPTRDTLILREYAGTTPAFREQMAALPLSVAQIAATAIRQRRAVTCEVNQHPTPAIRDLYRDQGFRHLTAVPVAGREEILGVLHLASRREPPLTADETALVEAIGGLVGVALENAALRERMAAQQDRLRALLAREPDVQVVAEAGDGREVLRLAQETRPDVAAMDLSMPLLNGLEAARQMASWDRGPRSILLTMHADDRYVLEALRAGVRGYVLKKQAAADLVRAIREVAGGSVYLSPGISAAVVEAIRSPAPLREDSLTTREREVLQLVAEGKTTKEISAILGVSVKTADAHRTRLMQKLDIHDIAGLTRYAIRQGLIQP